MGKRMIAMLLAMVALSAHAAQWKLVESDENRTQHFMDESSVTKNGATVQYWAKSVYPAAHYMPDHSAYTVVSRQYLAQCPEESQVPIQQVFYDHDGHVVSRSEAAPGTAPQANAPVIPGSYQEWMLDYACRQGAAG